jgi:hypothetical protein
MAAIQGRLRGTRKRTVVQSGINVGLASHSSHYKGSKLLSTPAAQMRHSHPQKEFRVPFSSHGRSGEFARLKKVAKPKPHDAPNG